MTAPKGERAGLWGMKTTREQCEHIDANGNVWRMELRPVWACDEIGQVVAARPRGEFAYLPARKTGGVANLAALKVETGLPMEVSCDAPGGPSGFRDALVGLYAHEVGNPHDRPSEAHCFECGRDY